MSRMQILHLNKAGIPTGWINREEAAVLYTKDRVLWEIGNQPSVIRGGVNRLGNQSQIDIAPIIATLGDISKKRFVPVLVNSMLFRRDCDRCMYCGEHFSHCDLSRDHIVPRGQGGKDIWQNVVITTKVIVLQSRRTCRYWLYPLFPTFTSSCTWPIEIF